MNKLWKTAPVAVLVPFWPARRYFFGQAGGRGRPKVVFGALPTACPFDYQQPLCISGFSC
jgi:hypothetical protein